MRPENARDRDEDADAGVQLLASLFVLGTITIVGLWFVVTLLRWVRA
jgi:hypothetical protein